MSDTAFARGSQSTSKIITKDRSPRIHRDGDVYTDKDDTELELEKLVFGDDAGFHNALRTFEDGAVASNSTLPYSGDEEEEGDQAPGEAEGLEGVNDADVCSSYCDYTK